MEALASRDYFLSKVCAKLKLPLKSCLIEVGYPGQDMCSNVQKQACIRFAVNKPFCVNTLEVVAWG